MMSFFELMGIIATVALLIPFVLILVYRLSLYRAFPALLGYLSLLAICNLLLLNYIPLRGHAHLIQNIIQNLLVAPLIFLFLTYFSRTVLLRRRMHWVFYSVLGIEVLAVLIFGVSSYEVNVLSGATLALTISFALIFFVHQVKLTITYQKALGKALIVSSLLFAAIGLGYIYGVRVFADAGYQHDADLIQFLIVTLTSVSLSAGIYFEQKRVKQLEELRITREELKEIYGHDDEKATDPFETVALNFDSDRWH